MASPTRWTWVWVNSGSWWWTGRPGALQFMGMQRVGHDWATELNWTESIFFLNRASASKRALNVLWKLGRTGFFYAAKSLQPCPTLWDPIDGNPPGSAVPGILQAKTLEWVAISFSIAWKWKVKVKSLNRVWLLVTPWTAAYQAPLSMGFSRQEYWSGLPLPSLYI